MRMNKRNFFTAIVLFLFVTVLTTCTYDKEGAPLPDSGYPDNIAKIFVSKCAAAGCHNTQSKDGAGGFDLSTWDHLFEGGRNGSSVIPYRADQSFLMYFINTYTDLGISLSPLMPYNGQALSHDEVVTVRNWIRNGAPDRKGNIKFCCDANRRKFYVCNQGCDLVTVFDSQTRLPMRVIDVGVDPVHTESPHDIVVSPDGNYWYVVFLSGQVMQKFRTSDDSLVGQVTLGAGQWTAMTISDDSHYAFVVDFTGSVAFVDLNAMTLQTSYTGLNKPHGCTVSHDFKTLYVTAQQGNYIYKFDITDPMNPNGPDAIILEPQGPTHFQYFLNKYDPHQIDISPDGTKYFVTCQLSSEVRVMSVADDTLLAVIHTGADPQELEFSESSSRPYLFVSCMDDSTTYTGWRGTVAVINWQTNTFIKPIVTGWQPHGLNVDDNAGFVYVANRNVTQDGPAPHHSSSCGGRNGNVTIIEMNVLDPTQMEIIPGYKVEVSVDPYEVGVRK